MKLKKFSFYFFTAFIFLIIQSEGFSQTELVPSSHRVYEFLERMLVNKVIDNFSSSIIPISRRETGLLLTEVNKKRKKISTADRKLLDDFMVEFEYDMNGTLKNSSSFFSGLRFGDIFSDRKQKYLYANSDSNTSIFLDGIGSIRYNGADGDSLGKPHIALGELGIRIRGTLFNSVGYYLRLSNGGRLSGTEQDAFFASEFDPVLASTRKFVSEGSKFYDNFEGYVRYSTASNWLGLTVGREALSFGTGYIDKLVLSNRNAAPFDFIKLDLAYKKLRYSFFHSSIVGNDSTGKQLESKYLVFHRFELGPFFNNVFKLGFSEMLIYSGIPVNFAFLNPFSFLTSADLNTELPGKNSNNTLLSIDMQFYPVKKFTFQGTLLIDDINFETLGSDSSKGNDNKFAFQAGFSWQDAFTLPNLNLIYEYTKLDPFIYSHREVNNSYSNWGLPVGHALNPNSDEHALKLAYSFGSRLSISVTYKIQRSGMNITDSIGNVITNVGSDILNGRGDFAIKNEFLNGIRVNRDIIIAEITWQPVRQYFLSLKYQNRSFDYTEQNRKLSDSIFWGSLRIDY